MQGLLLFPLTRLRGHHLLPMLVGQFADGFGARYHGLLLLLYATQVAGLAGFSGFTAAGLLGGVIAAAAAAPLAARVSSRELLAGSAAVLTLARLVSYALLLSGSGLAGLLALRLVGSVCGTVLTNAAKACTPAERGGISAASLAWVGAANGVGGALGAAAAGMVSLWGPTWLIVASGATVAAAATLPLLRAAWAQPSTTMRSSPRFADYRRVAPAAALGASVGFFTAGIHHLREGITVDLYSAAWLGPVSLLGLAGVLLAGPVLRRLPDWGPGLDRRVWPLLGIAGVLGWGVADYGIAALLIAQVATAFFAAVFAASVEARLLALAGPAHAVALLTAAGALSALTATLAVLAFPWLLATGGYVVATVVCSVPLLGIALVRRPSWLRNHSTVRANPSASPTVGSQPRRARALVMSGRR